MNRPTLNLPRTARRALRPEGPLRPTLEDGLRALQEASDLATEIRVELTDEYRRLIEAVEALPENQAGADKGGRWRGAWSYWRFVEDARLVERRE